uniref:Uncharacterized protein n=1 Tax=Culex tarsalis TaxID=7177 RepID=A0A1Q3FPK0_CULTA
MGSSALILGLAWFGVGVSMIYGVFKENKKLVYPTLFLYMTELFLLFIRDVVMVWRNEPSYKITFLDPVATMAILYVTMHILMSVVALGRLFQHEPLKQSSMDFRRLKSNQETEGTDELLEDIDIQASG